MSIEFSYHHDDQYLLVRYSGRIMDEALLKSWQAFFEKNYLGAGYNVLIDLEAADLSPVTFQGVEALTEFMRKIHGEKNIQSVRVANYAPDTLPFGMARSYEGMAIDSSENIKSFRSLEEARAWLKNDGSTHS